MNSDSEKIKGIMRVVEWGNVGKRGTDGGTGGEKKRKKNNEFHFIGYFLSR
jgi:hypothetical protein